jgi:hypothetical protein
MVRNPSVEVGPTGSYGCVECFAKRNGGTKDLRNKALLLAASIIDMVHGTKKKWTTACKEILSSGEAYKKFLAICKAKAVLGNLNCPIKILKPRNQVLSLKLTIEDLQKLQWLVHHDSKAGVLQNTNDKVKGRRVILYLFRNERRAKILDRLYEIRKEYYFNSIKRMKKIYFALRNEDLTTILIEKRRLKRNC